MCVVVVGAFFIEASGADAAVSGERVRPHAWARTMCAATLPAAESVAAESRAWPNPGPRPETVDELAVEVQMADRALGSLARYTRALRDGIRAAGVPAVPAGGSVVRHLRDDTLAYLGTVDLLRSAFAGFLVDHSSDPDGAVDRLMAVLDSPGGRLRVSFDIDAESPELARATRAVPACLEMASAIGAANTAINAATRIVRS
jgi:hypothetical protein